MRLFINQENLDFSAVADKPALQEFELVENYAGEIEYQTQVVKFQVTPDKHGARCMAWPDFLAAHFQRRSMRGHQHAAYWPTFRCFVLPQRLAPLFARRASTT